MVGMALAVTAPPTNKGLGLQELNRGLYYKQITCLSSLKWSAIKTVYSRIHPLASYIMNSHTLTRQNQTRYEPVEERSLTRTPYSSCQFFLKMLNFLLTLALVTPANYH